MFKYQALIKENLKDIAKLITLEQGKTLADAEGDVMRGLQVTSLKEFILKLRGITSFDFSKVVEHCCSNTNILMGETLPGITKDMDLGKIELNDK
jgi:malonate-semialdehyde dehydrogenase (acetylating)/methylmalonate-semialdehyde dehydrogenase